MKGDFAIFSHLHIVHSILDTLRIIVATDRERKIDRGEAIFSNSNLKVYVHLEVILTLSITNAEEKEDL